MRLITLLIAVIFIYIWKKVPGGKARILWAKARLTAKFTGQKSPERLRAEAAVRGVLNGRNPFPQKIRFRGADPFGKAVEKVAFFVTADVLRDDESTTETLLVMPTRDGENFVAAPATAFRFILNGPSSPMVAKPETESETKTEPETESETETEPETETKTESGTEPETETESEETEA